VGRNIFQHKDPTRLVAALNLVVHEDESVQKALKLIEGTGAIRKVKR
jgi:class I fructose-bisphosphate aldolase